MLETIGFILLERLVSYGWNDKFHTDGTISNIFKYYLFIYNERISVYESSH